MSACACLSPGDGTWLGQDPTALHLTHCHGHHPHSLPFHGLVGTLGAFSLILAPELRTTTSADHGALEMPSSRGLKMLQCDRCYKIQYMMCDMP